MQHDPSIPHARLSRDYCAQAITAHLSAYVRALAMFVQAHSDDERAQARRWMDNANAEVARWQKAWEVAS